MKIHPGLPAILLGCVLGAATAACAQTSSPWIRMGADGRLVYRADARGNHVPDFSNVGYGGGDVSFPSVPVKATVAPGDGDAGPRIQEAIDSVSKLPPDTNGFRGAVLLKPGRYSISGQVRLVASGVVLRGSGTNSAGTVLVATGTGRRSLIVIGKGEPQFNAESEDTDWPAAPVLQPGSSIRQITDEYVPVGARSFHLDSVAGLKVGEEVVVKRPSTAEWIHQIGMDRIPQKRNGRVVQWEPGKKDLHFSRVITRIQGAELTVDAPICNALEKKFGGGQVIVNPVVSATSHVGVESLVGDSEFKTAIDEDHAWCLVEVVDARNVRIRNLVARHFAYGCVAVQMPCKWITIEDCLCLEPVSKMDGGRRYAFALRGQLTLVQGCYSQNGRHDFVMHSLAAGPNAFVDCRADMCNGDSGPHHRWSVGVLYDNVRLTGKPSLAKSVSAGALNIRNRGSAGTGHGWAGANQVIWNCQLSHVACEQPPTAQNWVIGSTAGTYSGDAYQESAGKSVEPHSLFAAQLRERLRAEGR